mgnify:CR=1 FL=1
MKSCLGIAAVGAVLVFIAAQFTDATTGGTSFGGLALVYIGIMLLVAAPVVGVVVWIVRAIFR